MSPVHRSGGWDQRQPADSAMRHLADFGRRPIQHRSSAAVNCMDSCSSHCDPSGPLENQPGHNIGLPAASVVSFLPDRCYHCSASAFRPRHNPVRREMPDAPLSAPECRGERLHLRSFDILALGSSRPIRCTCAAKLPYPRCDSPRLERHRHAAAR